MLGSKPHRRYALVAALLLVSVFLLASVKARADTTYTIADQGVVTQEGWSVNGTITTDGAIGRLQPSDFLTATLSLSSPTYGTFTAESPIFANIGGISATLQDLIIGYKSGGIYITSSNGVKIYWGNPQGWYNPGWQDQYAATVPTDVNPPYGLVWDDMWEFDGSGNLSQDTGYGGPMPSTWLAQGDWVIATAVPEPTMLTLLVSALLGLAGAFYLRRRRVKA
jgi:hypothetical protein